MVEARLLEGLQEAALQSEALEYALVQICEQTRKRI